MGAARTRVKVLVTKSSNVGSNLESTLDLSRCCSLEMQELNHLPLQTQHFFVDNIFISNEFISCRSTQPLSHLILLTITFPFLNDSSPHSGVVIDTITHFSELIDTNHPIL